MTKDIKTKYDYELQVPFEYHYKGDLQEAQFITLLPPTSKNIADCADLKQAFMRAMHGYQDSGAAQAAKDSAVDVESDDFGGEGIMMLISMSKDVELKQVLLHGRELFSSGVALVDGETKVTKPILDNIDQDDLEAMIGEYYINFILASWWKKMKKN